MIKSVYISQSYDEVLCLVVFLRHSVYSVSLSVVVTFTYSAFLYDRKWHDVTCMM